MKLQIASDLHTEFHKKVTLEHFINKSADVLLLAGDVGIPGHPSYRSILEQCNANYRRVLLIKGNHEHYGSSLDETSALIRAIVGDLGNVTFLDDESYRFDEERTTILGSTLWSRVLPNERIKVFGTLNDYRSITLADGKSLYPKDINERHEKHVNWLTNEINRCATTLADERIVVMTHHLPSYKMCPPKYKHCGYNSAFASDLEHMITPPIRAWVCGHSHERRTEVINGVPCILNPSGYPSEVTRSDNKLVITID